MSKNSMTISNCAIDRIHASASFNERLATKKIIRTTTGFNDWELMPSEGFFANIEKEKNTGIILKWNELFEGSKNPQNGKLVCRIVGECLKNSSLNAQLYLLFKLSGSYSISQLDLKFQLNSPLVPMEGLQFFAYEAGLDKYPQIDYTGFDGFVNCTSGSKNSTARPHSAMFTKKGTNKKQLLIYDPIEKHGIANAQHWELRLKGDYVKPAIKLLPTLWDESDKAAELIAKIILDSINFTWNGKPWAWYERVKKAPLII